MEMKLIRFKDVRPVSMIATDKLMPNPAQPRQRFDDSALFSLSQSIRENGILHPLTVVKSPSGYLLISGERRLRAAKMAGLTKVPCLVVDVNDQTAAVMALLENLQRQDLNFFEEARALEKLLDFWGLTPEDLSPRLGISPSTLTEKLQLLTLTPWQQERVLAGELTEKQARLLLKIRDTAVRDEVLLRVIAKELTFSQTEQLVNQTVKEGCIPPPPKRQPVIGDMRLFGNTIQNAVATMNRSGVPATAHRQETDRMIEYTIHIPKNPLAMPEETQ